MDVIAADQLLRLGNSSKEETIRPCPSATRLVWTAIVMGAAFYVSWTCNTARGYSGGYKVWYGLWSALFGQTYLLLYFVFNRGWCIPRPPKIPVPSAPPAAYYPYL